MSGKGGGYYGGYDQTAFITFLVLILLILGLGGFYRY
jgi:hypothetical protein